MSAPSSTESTNLSSNELKGACRVSRIRFVVIGLYDELLYIFTMSLTSVKMVRFLKFCYLPSS